MGLKSCWYTMMLITLVPFRKKWNSRIFRCNCLILQLFSFLNKIRKKKIFYSAVSLLYTAPLLLSTVNLMCDFFFERRCQRLEWLCYYTIFTHVLAPHFLKIFTFQHMGRAITWNIILILNKNYHLIHYHILVKN